MVVYVADMDGIGIAFEPLEAARFGMNGVHKFGFGKSSQQCSAVHRSMSTDRGKGSFVPSSLATVLMTD